MPTAGLEIIDKPGHYVHMDRPQKEVQEVTQFIDEMAQPRACSMRGIVLSAFALSAPVFASCVPVGTDSASDRRSRVENSLSLAVSFEGEDNAQSVSERMSRYKVPGLSFALINDGEIEWAAGYGVKETGTSSPVSNQTLFQAASIAKPVVSVAALRMRDAGLIDLDENIQTYLSEYVIPDGEQTPANPVTFRNLLSHAAGVTPGGYLGYERGEAYPTDLQTVSGLPPANSRAVLVRSPPGSEVAYSGGGYTVVEIAMQDVTGESFERVMEDWALSVIGMNRSTYLQSLPDDLEDQVALGHMADGTAVPGGWRVHPEQAAAGLWTTPSDLALFAIEVRNAYLGEGDLLDRSTAVELLTAQLDDEGIGIIVRGEGETFSFAHGGGNVGYRAFMIMYVDSGDGAVYMTNSDQGSAVGREMLRAASSVYGWPGYKPTMMRRVAVERAALTPLEGTYDFGDGVQVVIALHDSMDQISITFPNGDKYALVPTGPLSFVHPETGVTVDFEGTDDLRKVIVYGDAGVRVGT